MSELGGSGSLVDVCTRIWEIHEIDLRNSGELFYTWQYEVRWAAGRLRRRRILKPVGICRPRVWEMETGGMPITMGIHNQSSTIPNTLNEVTLELLTKPTDMASLG